MTDASGQRCGNCKWYRDIIIGEGRCDLPVPEWITETIIEIHRQAFPLDPVRPPIRFIDDGRDCPTWQPRG